MFGMQPNMDRLNMLPRYDRKQGLIAPNALYQLARALVSPGVAAQGGYVSEEDAVNFGGNLVGAGLGASAATKGNGRTLGMAYYPKGLDAAKKAKFDEWFSGSKVADDAGAPRVVYHGTSGDFPEFRASRTGEFGPGVYFTSSPNEAGGYASTNMRGANAGQNIIPAYVKMKNPLVVKSPDDFWNRFPSETDGEAVQKAIMAGYDGIQFERPVQAVVNNKIVNTGEMQTHYVVFDPANIKSALSNAGTFDNSSSITK